MITLDDDMLHARNDDPYWNESAWFSLMIPERGINGFVYFYHRPNMRLSAGGPALWDHSGEEIYDCLYWDWDTCQPFPPGADMFDFSLRNGLNVTPLELQSAYRLGYEAPDCQLDLTWTSLLAPQEMRTAAPGRMNRGIADWLDFAETLSVGHYQQPGRMQGSANVNGQRLDVDCFSVRDHTWGPRPLRDHPRTGWVWAIASEGSSFLAVAASQLPTDEDPVVGTTEPVVHGWYVKDGTAGRLVEGTRRVVDRGDEGRPIRQLIDATDELGRTLHAEGVCENWLKWTGYSCSFDWWSLTRWQFDGRTTWGEAHDSFTIRQNRRFQRSLKAALTAG